MKVSAKNIPLYRLAWYVVTYKIWTVLLKHKANRLVRRERRRYRKELRQRIETAGEW